MSSTEILTITRFGECLELVIDVVLVSRVIVFKALFTRNCFPGVNTGTYSFSFTSLT